MGNCCIIIPRRSRRCCACCTKLPSCICCCSSNKARIQSQRSSLSKGQVHIVTKMDKWEEKISEARSNGKILVANFSASWCIPCREIAPVYQELANRYPSMIFVTVDVEELVEFSNEWNVEATPTIVFLRDGRQLDKLVGANIAELHKKTAAVADLLLRKS